MTATMIVQESAGLGQDISISVVDGVTFTTVVNSPILLATGQLAAGSVLDKSRVIEVQVEYESNAAQTLLFEYSTDGGASWAQFSTKTIGITNGPTILSVTKSITGHGIQLRLRSVILGAFRLLAFVPRVVQEARVFP